MWQRLALGIPAFVLFLVVAIVLVDTAASAGRIHPGVTVSGVRVGGLSQDAARERLNEALTDKIAEPIEIVFEDQSWPIAAADVSATVDAKGAADRAFAVGREGDVGALIRARAAAWLGGVDVIAPVSVDASLTSEVLGRVATGVERPARDATIVIEDVQAVLQPAELGIAMKFDAVRDAMLVAFVEDSRTVEVRVDFVPVSITDEDAAQALRDAQMMLSGGVTVTFEQTKWEFSAGQIAEWVAFRPVAIDASGTAPPTDPASSEVTTAGSAPVPGALKSVLEAYIDADKATTTIAPKVGTTGRSAQDATFKVGGGNVTIVPSQDGIGPDLESLAAEMSRVLKTDDARVVELRTQRVEPDITTEDAQNMGIRERIATYTTTYASGNRPRVNNIHILADAIDGTLLAPGATFSFNETVGPRTAAKGYQEANAIVNGRLVPQLGGGICQFGTTIFNTVFESGLPVVERKNHSFYISYYPKGRDATLSWGGPDFKFKNDTEHWILIATGYTDTSVTVSLYGTSPGYDVTSEVGPWTDVKPHTVKETPDPTLPSGSRKIEEAGVDGRTIVVKRFVRKGGVLVREDSFRSVYRPKEEIVRLGTKVVPSQNATVAP
jgi:vancomycin resistance protein YoaR